MRNSLLAVVLLMLFGNISQLQAQPGKENNPYILFTGLVLTSDSLQAIPYVTMDLKTVPCLASEYGGAALKVG